MCNLNTKPLNLVIILSFYVHTSKTVRILSVLLHNVNLMDISLLLRRLLEVYTREILLCTSYCCPYMERSFVHMLLRLNM